MLSLLLSFVILLIIAYNFTDILQQNGGFKQTLFFIVLTTIYTYIMSSIDKETFRIRFGLLGVMLYIIGVAGMSLCGMENQNSVITALSSIVAMSFLIVGVVRLNG